MGLWIRPRREQRTNPFAMDSRLPVRYPTGNSWLPPAQTLTDIAGLPTVYACVNLIADTLAGLPVHALEDDGVGAQQRVRTPLGLADPNPPASRVETVAEEVTSLLLEGNLFAYVLPPDESGWPAGFVPLDPYQVGVERRGGQLFYTIAGQTFTPDEILHVRAFTWPGEVRGIGPLTLHARTFYGARSSSDYAGRFFDESAVPPLVMESTTELTKDQLIANRDRWRETHAGGNREPAFIHGMKPHRLSITNEEAQFLETRKHADAEIARLFGVPPSLVNVDSGGSLRYENPELEGIAFTRWTLQRWVSRLEAALNRYAPPGQVARFSLDALLRADTATRYATHEKAVRNGLLSVNEVRALENLAPLDTDQRVWPPYRGFPITSDDPDSDSTPDTPSEVTP